METLQIPWNESKPWKEVYGANPGMLVWGRWISLEQAKRHLQTAADNLSDRARRCLSWDDEHLDAYVSSIHESDMITKMQYAIAKAEGRA